MRTMVLAATLVLACALPVQETPIPDWLEQVIAKLEAEPVTNPPASITRYDYKGQTVYYLPPHCCDVPSVLYDSMGVVLCGPDGGLTGRGDGRCADFFSERRGGKLIWQDPRPATISSR